MAKESGLGDQLYVDGYDLGGDIQSLSGIHGGPAALDVTAITKSAHERIGGTRDGGLTFVAYFNPAAGAAHPRLAALPTADVQVMYLHGMAQGNDAACLIAKQLNYDGTRANDGAFTFNVQAVADGFGLEWGTQLTAGIRNDTTATSGAPALDMAASTSFGWQAYLQTFALIGTSATVTLQDSADNVTFTNLSGGAFTAATAIGTQRIASATPTATVRRYVRVATTGTFTVANFAVVLVKNQAVSVTF